MTKKNKNSIEYIDSKNADLIKEQLKTDKNILLAELYGKEIQTWGGYASVIERIFKFPTSCIDSMDRYLDWMRDLEWLEQKEFVILINNYNDFCKGDSSLKEEIVLDLKETILPFWEEEVVNSCVEGMSKSFMVYLIED
ncbi:MAG: hypothetical protein K0S76_3049 [Herbinix sp.]|jgi:hypothetical protein|nr:hypothetical protein [Herbinix sp.]